MKTVYALGSAGAVWMWIWGLLALGAGIVLAGHVKEFHRQHMRDRNVDANTVSTVIFGLIVCLLFVALASHQYGKRRVLIQAADRAPIQIAEGCVEVVHEQPSGGHSRGDLIVVGGTQFEIDYFRFNVGYGATISHGGVLRAGTAVRIHHYGNIIVRIDTLPTQCP